MSDAMNAEEAFVRDMLNAGKSPEEKAYVAEEIKKITERAQKANEKVKNKALILLENVKKRGGNADAFRISVEDLEADFFTLREDPQDEQFGGRYNDWTTGEIEDLYEVLYGRSMDNGFITRKSPILRPFGSRTVRGKTSWLYNNDTVVHG